jgi:arogenate/prephenate dehydratase
MGDTRPFKTSIVFSLGDGSGQLFKALAVFSLRDLDLLKIESRPVRNNPLINDGSGSNFNYLFYVDFMGKLCDDQVQNALRNLEELAPFVRVLGSFPMDVDLGTTNVEAMFDKWNE